jgi:hypothetical protein
MFKPADYRVLLVRTTTGEVIDELRVSELSVRRRIAAPGSMSVVAADRRPWDVREVEHSLLVLRAGVPAWFGVIWRVQLDRQASTWRVDCGDPLSMMAWRVIRGDLIVRNRPQEEILRVLLDLGQRKTRGSVRLDTSSIVAGSVVRSRTWEGRDATSVLDAVLELARVRDGVRWRLVPVFDSGVVVVRVETDWLSSPVLAGVIVEDGVTAELVSLTRDGTGQRTLVDGWWGDAGGRVTEVAADASSRPAMEVAVSRRDVPDAQTMRALAARLVDEGRVGVSRTEWVLRPGFAAELVRLCWPGDVVRVRAPLWGVDQEDTVLEVVETARPEGVVVEVEFGAPPVALEEPPPT